LKDATTMRTADFMEFIRKESVRQSAGRVTVALLMCCLVLGGTTAACRADDDLSSLRLWPVEQLQQQIQAWAGRSGSEAAGTFAEAPILLWSERCFLGTNDAYSSEGVRYLVLRLSIGNPGETDLQLKSENITLRAEGRTYPVGVGKSAGLRGGPLEIDWHPERTTRAQSQLETPAVVIVPAKQAATFWCTFAGFPAVPVVPDLQVLLKFEEGPEAAFDLTAQQKTRLGLTQQTLGPGGALTAWQIHGQLNRINARLLAEKMQAAHDRGCQRFVVDWASEAFPSDEALFGWLLATANGTRDGNMLHQQMPPLPDVRALNLAHLPAGNADVAEWEDGRARIFSEPERAAAAALEEVFQRASSQVILSEIRTGHPWSRLAALESGGSRLSEEAYSTLRSLADSRDRPTRDRAIQALGGQPAGESFLLELIHGADDEKAVQALTGLVHDADEHRQQVVQQLLQDPAFDLPSEQVLPVLAASYRPAWNDYVVRCLSSASADIRCSALELLHQIGHPRLYEISSAALHDDDARVRQAAFSVLIESRQRAMVQTALDYALSQLRAGRAEEPELALIESQREVQAAPLLLELMDRTPEMRVRLIEVLGQVGTADDCRQVLARLHDLGTEEQVAALRLASHVSFKERLKLVREAAESNSEMVRLAAVETLEEIGSDDAVGILGSLLSRAASDEIPYLCQTLAGIGTLQAVRTLRTFRGQAVKNRKIAVIHEIDEALKGWRNSQPGWNFIEAGHMQVGGDDLDEAVKTYSMAILINPELADAYSSRGNVLLRQNEYKKAGEDFRRALELDPIDSQAVTGIAIVQSISGDWEQAVAFVEQHADEFPQDRFYPYNRACVYARAVEFLKKQPASMERDQHIGMLQTKALEQLELAVRHGFRQFDWMRKDPDLASIRDLPEFQKLSRTE